MANRRYNTQTRKPFSKGSFSDYSGDGKITKKDILMAKGVIKKVKPTLGLKKTEEYKKKLKEKNKKK